jgi:hypothetical protein
MLVPASCPGIRPQAKVHPCDAAGLGRPGPQLQPLLPRRADFGRTQLHLDDLHHSTLERWFLDEAADLDYPAHLQQALACFSGQLAVDELYDGQYHVLKVTDPLNNLEITSWLGVGSPDADDIRALFSELYEAGFVPELVVTDGSTLYPAPIAEIWPEADHQLCVFHFLQGALVTLTKSFWSAYKTMPVPPEPSPHFSPCKRAWLSWPRRGCS